MSAAPPRTIQIDPLSVVPLLLTTEKNGAPTATGTGFIVERPSGHFLITNWHVVTGRNPETGDPMTPGREDPEAIQVYLHGASQLGSWNRHRLRLLNSGKALWREHPNGRAVDVVALPVSIPSDSRIYSMDVRLADTDLLISPSEDVSVIGFPFGTSSAGVFPIWKTGHVASDIDLDYSGLPAFLIDATARPGMSGSPVVARRIGMHRSSRGLNVGTGDVTRFLGIFSGSIRAGSELGVVWKPDVLGAIFS